MSGAAPILIYCSPDRSGFLLVIVLLLPLEIAWWVQAEAAATNFYKLKRRIRRCALLDLSKTTGQRSGN
jgi:hypothetical protein